MGFADDQLKRMTGRKGRNKKGQRPEIEKKYGYDVKAAMHTLRLLYQCKELLSEERITLPRPERDFLIRVRTGKYSRDKVTTMAQTLFCGVRGGSQVVAAAGASQSVRHLATSHERLSTSMGDRLGSVIFASGIMGSDSPGAER